MKRILRRRGLRLNRNSYKFGSSCSGQKFLYNVMSVKQHLLQIDLLKGAAIIGILAEHTVAARALLNNPITVNQSEMGAAAIAPGMQATFTSVVIGTFLDCFLRQAVPIFIVIIGLNSAMSFTRRRYVLFKDWSPKDYFSRRCERYYVPYIIIFLASLLVGLYETHITGVNEINLSIFAVIGRLPIYGPGDYFIPIIFQFLFLFPVLFYFYQKRPKGLLVLCFAAGVAFQYSFYFLHLVSYAIYAQCIIRFLPVIALGFWISQDFGLFSKRNRYILPGAILSVAILFFTELTTQTNILSSLAPAMNLLYPLTFFYTTLIIIAGIHYLPKEAKHRLGRTIACLGNASYHIFLVQIVYFGLFINLDVLNKLNPNSNTLLTIVIFLANIMLCLGCGLLFMHATNKLLKQIKPRHHNQ